MKTIKKEAEEHAQETVNRFTIDELIYNRINRVSGRFLKCIKPITNIRKGSGCVVGRNYWFEYVHNDTKSFYRKLSDNNHYDEVYITDEELGNNFIF